MTFKMLLVGEAGAGKTYCTHTLPKAGYKVRFLAAESNAQVGVKLAKERYTKDTKEELTADQFAVSVPSRPKRLISDLIIAQQVFLAKTLNSQYKEADPKRRNYTRYLEVLKATINFVDTATETSFRKVDTWGEDTVLVLDNLTVISDAIRLSVLGGKIDTSLPEWGVMQKLLMDFLRQITEELTCNVVLIAHPHIAMDAVNNIYRIYPDSLGKSLCNQIPTLFTETVWAYRSGTKFYWATVHKKALTRVSQLPLSEQLEPDFKYFSRPITG